MQLTPRMIAFCRDPVKVKEMRQLMELPIMIEARSIMADSSPASTAPIGEEITPHFANILLGMVRGYTKYHNLFEYFGLHFEAQPSDEDAAIRLESED